MDIPSALGGVAALAGFDDATRLYGLEGGDLLSTLQVERWRGEEQLSTCYQWTLDVLSLDAGLSLAELLGQRAALRITRADGARDRRSGLISEVQALGSDGGWARYRLQLVPWLWLLSQGRHSRVFQHRTVLEIIEAVFADYADYAAWMVTADAHELMKPVRAREYTVQYRETDLDFVERLLAEEGLGYAFVEDEEAPAGHRLVIFGDSGQLPEDASSAAGSGLRYHRAAAVEESDTLQALEPLLRLRPDRLTFHAYDGIQVRSVVAGAVIGGAVADREIYDPVGQNTFADSREAEHYATLAAQAHEAQQQSWWGRGSVRTARVGTRFAVTQAPWQDGSGPTTAPDAFVWTRLQHAGINNLPAGQRDQSASGGDDHEGHAISDPELWQQADHRGYAQQFEAVAVARPWRPALIDETGTRLNPRPTAPGLQTATVVGPDGESSPGATGPLYVDALGRIQVRFHWQSAGASAWLRVVQRYAGAGHGMQALPRIGQEVLVNFLDGDIDRPIVVGAVYNGQGEGGIAASPGAAAVAPSRELYAQARDRQASAQGNLAGGNSPAWHGLSGDETGHRNAAALSGFKTQGFDGNGHNQLVIDDSDRQGRIQMATTQAASYLNLGHLIHQADNHRGSFRGRGFELRTDAFGAVRGRRGVLLSTYPLPAAAPAGDAEAAVALAEQHRSLNAVFSEAAQTHATPALASAVGVRNAQRSQLDADAAPLAAHVRSLSGRVPGDDFGASGQATGDDSADHVPHSGDALLTLAGRGGIAITAAQGLHVAADETVSLGSGQGLEIAVAQQMRLHSGQAIGWLAGAQQGKPGGLELIASQGAVDVQAQHDVLAVRSRDDLTLASINADLSIAAKQTVHLAVSGGAYLTIEGGRITFGCPGKITVHAAQHRLEGAAHRDEPQSQFPASDFRRKRNQFFSG